MGRDIYLLKKAKKKIIPLHSLIELTYKCNLRCVHCYVVKDYSKEEIDTTEIFSVLRQLKKLGCLYLTLSGGEILMRPDFFEIARYARKLNFGLRLFSNGTLIDEENADKIKGLYPLAVEISIHGFKEIHDKITQVSGSFNKAINAIALLKKRKIEVLVKATLMRQNVQEFWKLQEYIHKLGVRPHYVGGNILISACDDGGSAPLRYRLTDTQLKGYLSEEFKKCEHSGLKYFPREVRNNEILCLSGIAGCNITPYGHVNPCSQIKLKGGNNLRYKSLKKIWTDNKQLREIRNLRESDREDCSKCKLRPFCHICPGMALLERGTLLDKLPEACRIARIRKEVYEGA